ncbi:CocE/NonD family hydrolase [Streptosporangium sp. NPDC004631]
MTGFVDVGRVRCRFLRTFTTRDGVELSADVYLPPEPGRYPVLVTRTPYDNNRTGALVGLTRLPAPSDRHKHYAAHGYVVVAVDVRGRGDSGGGFTPFRHEAEDGADTVAWARRLPECDGRVAVFGTGYAGFCAWAAAAESRQVDAVAAISPFGGPGAGLPWTGGALRLDWLFWMHLVGGRTVQPADVPPWSSVWRHLPAATMHEALGRDDIWWSDWSAHPDPDDPYWAALRLADRIAGLDVPALHVTGWWDGQLAATTAYWEAARRSPGGARQRLVVGPWDTRAVRRPTREVGGFDWGVDSVVDIDRTVLDFFGEQFTTAPQAGPATRIFVTGRNSWTDGRGMPESPGIRSLWLSSGGRANTRQGDGRLVAAPVEGGEPADRYDYDPARPVAWQPRFASHAVNASPGLGLDEGHATNRDDVLCYTGEPFTEATELFGTPSLELWASTDAPDTDWVATLSDVLPSSGRTLHLGHAVVRAGARNAVVPGEPARYTLRFPPLAHVLLPGHRLRLAVTSSLFPLYARNPNTGEYAEGETCRTARQEILHGGRHPSRLVLPMSDGPDTARTTDTA